MQGLGVGPDLGTGCMGYCCYACCCFGMPCGGAPAGKASAKQKADFNKTVVPKKGKGISR